MDNSLKELDKQIDILVFEYLIEAPVLLNYSSSSFYCKSVIDKMISKGFEFYFNRKFESQYLASFERDNVFPSPDYSEGRTMEEAICRAAVDCMQREQKFVYKGFTSGRMTGKTSNFQNLPRHSISIAKSDHAYNYETSLEYSSNTLKAFSNEKYTVLLKDFPDKSVEEIAAELKRLSSNHILDNSRTCMSTQTSNGIPHGKTDGEYHTDSSGQLWVWSTFLSAWFPIKPEQKQDVVEDTTNKQTVNNTTVKSGVCRYEWEHEWKVYDSGWKTYEYCAKCPETRGEKK